MYITHSRFSISDIEPRSHRYGDIQLRRTRTNDWLTNNVSRDASVLTIASNAPGPGQLSRQNCDAIDPEFSAIRSWLIGIPRRDREDNARTTCPFPRCPPLGSPLHSVLFTSATVSRNYDLLPRETGNAPWIAGNRRALRFLRLCPFLSLRRGRCTTRRDFL